MSYIKIPLIKYNNTLRRPYYIAEIINTGKNIINFTEPTQFDVNILYSADTIINSIQSRVNKVFTFIPLVFEDPMTLTEPNVDDNNGDLRYGVEFTRGQTLYLHENGKIQDLLLDIESIGTAGKIILEIETNVAI